MYPSAKVIADSISPQGIRMLSFEITAHRWILAEINTHRALSRNYRSSRAVPAKKLIEEVRTSPAMPLVWLRNQPGMVGGEPLPGYKAELAKSIWSAAAKDAAFQAEWLSDTGLHKAWVNRLLEPFLFVHGVISGTDWANFYALRRAPDAQPEFKALADAMWEAQQASTPTLLQPGEWHLPYCPDVHGKRCTPAGSHAIETSVARVARVSIKPFDSEAVDLDKDLALYDRLLKDRHMSPFEHQATPDEWDEGVAWGEGDGWAWPERHGNLRGWQQYRKAIPGECVLD